MRATVIPAVVVAALALAGCGDEDDPEHATDSRPTATAGSSAPEPPGPDALDDAPDARAARDHLEQQIRASEIGRDATDVKVDCQADDEIEVEPGEIVDGFRCPSVVTIKRDGSCTRITSESAVIGAGSFLTSVSTRDPRTTDCDR